MNNLIGKKLGNYRLSGLIGKGGNADVYRARQETINRDVAIKIIDTQGESRDFIKRFEREAQTMAALSHPHIIKVFEFGAFDEYVFLVMELMPNGTLSRLIRKQGALPIKGVYRLMQQLASALDYAHKKEIVHRDLKPQNALLDENFNVILTDFGIARLLSKGFSLATLIKKFEELSETVTGTPAYMSPEQWQNENIDSRADIYALGVMLFEMLTGRLPFVADKPQTMMYLHMYHKPPMLRTIVKDMPNAVELDEVILKTMTKAREDRYQTISEMMVALRAAISGNSQPQAEASQQPLFGSTTEWDLDDNEQVPSNSTFGRSRKTSAIDEIDPHGVNSRTPTTDSYRRLKPEAPTEDIAAAMDDSANAASEQIVDEVNLREQASLAEESPMPTPRQAASEPIGAMDFEPIPGFEAELEDIIGSVFAPTAEATAEAATKEAEPEEDDGLTWEDRIRKEKFVQNYVESVHTLKRASTMHDLPDVIYMPPPGTTVDIPIPPLPVEPPPPSASEPATPVSESSTFARFYDQVDDQAVESDSEADDHLNAQFSDLLDERSQASINPSFNPEEMFYQPPPAEPAASSAAAQDAPFAAKATSIQGEAATGASKREASEFSLNDRPLSSRSALGRLRGASAASAAPARDDSRDTSPAVNAAPRKPATDPFAEQPSGRSAPNPAPAQTVTSGANDADDSTDPFEMLSAIINGEPSATYSIDDIATQELPSTAFNFDDDPFADEQNQPSSITGRNRVMSSNEPSSAKSPASNKLKQRQNLELYLLGAILIMILVVAVLGFFYLSR
jgi:serine/threonine protein kinase